MRLIHITYCGNEPVRRIAPMDNTKVSTPVEPIRLDYKDIWTL